MNKNIFEANYPWPFPYKAGDKVVCKIINDQYNRSYLYISGHIIAASRHGKYSDILKKLNVQFPDFIIIEILSFENGQLMFSFHCLDNELNIIKNPSDYQKLNTNRFLGKSSNIANVGEIFQIRHTANADNIPIYSVAKQGFQHYIFLDCFREDVESNVFKPEEHFEEIRTITIEEILDDGFVIYSINELDENCKVKSVKSSVKQNINSKNFFTIESGYGFSNISIGDKIVCELREFIGDKHAFPRCIILGDNAFPIDNEVFDKIKAVFPDFVVVNVLNFHWRDERFDDGVYPTYKVLTFSFDCMDDDGNIIKTPNDYRTNKNVFLGKIINRDTELSRGDKLCLYRYNNFDYMARTHDFHERININFYHKGFNIFILNEHFKDNMPFSEGGTITIREILHEGYVLFSIDDWSSEYNDDVWQEIKSNIMEPNAAPNSLTVVNEDCNPTEISNENNSNIENDISLTKKENDKMSKNIFETKIVYNLPMPLCSGNKIVCEFIEQSKNDKSTQLAFHSYDFTVDVDTETVRKIKEACPEFCVINIISFDNHLLTFSFDCLDQNLNIIKTQSDYKNNKNRFLGLADKEISLDEQFEYFEDSAMGMNTKTQIYSGFYREDCNVLSPDIIKAATTEDTSCFFITIEEILDNGFVIFRINCLDENCDAKIVDVSSDVGLFNASKSALFTLEELAEITNNYVIEELAKFQQDRKASHLQDILFHLTNDSSHTAILMTKATIRFFDNTDTSQKDFSTALRNAVFAYLEFEKDKSSEKYLKFIENIFDLKYFSA